MPDLSAVDWKAVGAVAGPVLALLALAWQASERLRRPALDAWYRFDVSTRMEEAGDAPAEIPWCMGVTGRVRVVNPRPSALIVEAVELQARERRGLPWARRRLRRKRIVEQIPPHSEAEFVTGYDNLSSSVTLRLRIRLRGRRRWISSDWEHAGEAMFEGGSPARDAYNGYTRTSDPLYPPLGSEPKAAVH